MSLAKHLKHFRALTGLSQNSLANHAGVSRSTIARWELGEYQKPSYAQIQKVAKAVRVNPEKLVNGPGPFAMNMRLLREDMGLTVEDLSERSRVTAKTLRQIERGTTKRLAATDLKRLSRILGVSPNNLLQSSDILEETA